MNSHLHQIQPLDLSEKRHAGKTRQSECCEHVLRVVGSYFDLSMVELLSPTRGKKTTAFARQVAMYLANTIYRVPVPVIAKTLGRDRSTVLFGLNKIEDSRDEGDMDTILECLEFSLKHTQHIR